MTDVNFLPGLQHIYCSTDKAKKLMLFQHRKDPEHLQNTDKWMPVPATRVSEKDWKISRLCGIVEQLIPF